MNQDQNNFNNQNVDNEIYSNSQPINSFENKNINNTPPRKTLSLITGIIIVIAAAIGIVIIFILNTIHKW